MKHFQTNYVCSETEGFQNQRFLWYTLYSNVYLNLLRKFRRAAEQTMFVLR